MFYNCSGLTNITIPDRVTSIGVFAFNSCGFTSITLPNNITTIGDCVFSSCIRLISITIPDSVISIGQYAFIECLNLTNIRYNGTIEQWNAIEKESGWNFETGNYTIHCTDGDIKKR